MSESELLVLDLEHLGSPGVMCTYVVVGDEVAIVDPGPSTTLPTLERALGGHGISLTDVRHILLTHVHLDHAGATGHLASRLPGVLVHLHRDGAPHIVDPVRLVASTRRTFGDAHDRLWGEVLPVTAGQIRAWEPGERGPMPGLRAFHSPGHIAHHLAYLDERTGTLLAGDALGIVLAPGAATHAPTPAPSLDIEAWLRTLVDLAWLEPERMGVTHFGLHENVTGRRRELYRRLKAVEGRVLEALDRDEDAAAAALTFDREVRTRQSEGAPTQRVEAYFGCFPATMDWAGVARYVRSRNRRMSPE